MKKNFGLFLTRLLVLAISYLATNSLAANEPTYIKCKAIPMSLLTLRNAETSNDSQQQCYPCNRYHHLVNKPRRHLYELPQEGTSTNWSGYAAATNLTHPTNGAVTFVSGAWVVPTLSASSSPQTYSAIWVGIDGYLDNTVEQIGTEQDWYNGQQYNYAWFEMYPNGSQVIQGFPVNNNDVIIASVKYRGNNVFVMAIQNYTQNVYTVIPVSQTTSPQTLRSSAEWIVEAPASTSILPLANFGTVNMFGCYATINGINGAINNTSWNYNALTMQTPGAIPKAVPSALLDGGDAFTVTWEHQ